MAKVAVDIDSTLYDFEAAARDAFFEIAYERKDKSVFRGAYHPWQEWRSPDDATGSEIWLEAVERTHQPDVILKQHPFPGAVETIRELLDDGHEVFYISNRAAGAKDATTQWLDLFGFLADEDAEVICTMNEKARYLGDCQYIIDDRPKTLVEFVYDKSWAKGTRKGFGLMFEYNRALTDIPNIYLAPTWYGLKYYLTAKGVLTKREKEIAWLTG